MTEATFWGKKGEYGPFPAQEDGWPLAGAVIRHYRRLLHMSAAELARRYGEAIGEPVTPRWIFKMEQENKVPADISRRRALATILHIPPLLLGLASLEDLTAPPSRETEMPRSALLQRNTPLVDLTRYEQFVSARWLLSYTGEESFAEVLANIAELETCEQESGGAYQERIRKALNSHYQLASDIARHRGDFSTAWMYADKAVRVTNRLGINDFLAAALYRRGYTNLEWAVFGDQVLLMRINHVPDRTKIEAALRDFEVALPLARPQLKGAIWIEISRAQAIMKQSAVSLHLIGQAEDMVEKGGVLSDPVDQILLEGALNGLTEGMYLLGKAATLIALGRTTTALEMLDDLEGLKNGKRIASNQTRRLAYMNLLRAEASLGTRDYLLSASSAISAFLTFRDIHTVERIAWINDIYSRLVEKYGNRAEVKELGEMLAAYKKDLTANKPLR